MFGAAGAAHATDYSWTGAVSTSWADPANWADALNARATAAPGAGDTAFIGPSYVVEVASDVTVAAMQLASDSTLQGAGTVTVTGTMNVDGATLDGSGPVNVPTGGTLNFNEPTTTLDPITPAPKKASKVKKKIRNNGLVNVNCTELTLGGDLENNVSGVVNIKKDGSIKWPDLNKPKLNNNGRVIKSGGNGTTTIEASIVNNTGSVELQSGTLSFTCNYAQSSGSTMLDGGNLETSGTLNITGGTLEGTGSITGNVINNGGNVKPGHSPGIITINGNYTQTASGILDMEIGGLIPGTGHDQMIVNGEAFLDGTLNVIKYNGFLLNDGDNVQLMTYYGDTGQFTTVNGLYPGSQRYYRLTWSPTYLVLTGFMDTVRPTISVTQPVHNVRYTSIGSATGTASDATTGVNGVTVVLYRYATNNYPAGYWAGGANWTSSYYAPTNELPAYGTTSWGFTFPALANGQYYIRATAKDKAGNLGCSPYIIFNKTPGASPYTLSTAVADSGVPNLVANRVILTFTGPLEATIASQAWHYTITVNGSAVSVQSASYNAATNQVTLNPPAGTLQRGETVVVTWTNLYDAYYRALSGSTTLTTQ
ncbi:MAG: hypothetical protein M3347_17615 [Armatimonadota bacterium]|nr:hypothetical protein [Armatimonadota bacterium]